MGFNINVMCFTQRVGYIHSSFIFIHFLKQLISGVQSPLVVDAFSSNEAATTSSLHCAGNKQDLHTKTEGPTGDTGGEGDTRKHKGRCWGTADAFHFISKIVC